MFVSKPTSLELSGSDQASAAQPSSLAHTTSHNHANDPLATNDPSTELALLMYRAKIDVGNENEDVDALFAAHLVQETNRLAQDMNGMSAEEREQAYFDLHGIPSNSSSSTASAFSSADTDGVTGSNTGSNDEASCSQRVAANWIEFRNEIDNLPTADRQGYELACELEATRMLPLEQHQRSLLGKSWSSPRSWPYSIGSQESYVFNERRLFAFFQSSRWNCKATAEQFVAFWAIKLQLFGKDLLLHDIKLSDLDAEELAWLETGHIQLLPGTDRAGRVVFCIYRRLMRPMAVEKQASVMVLARFCGTCLIIGTNVDLLSWSFSMPCF
jgi:hypothetical protein